MLENKPQKFDFLTAEGRKRKKDYAIALRYQQGLNRLNARIEAHADAINALTIGEQLELKKSRVEEYHTSTPGSWHRASLVRAARDEKDNITIFAECYFDDFVQYHTGRSYRDRDERYHQLDHETHIIVLNQNYSVVSVESGSKHEVIGDFVSDPWQKSKYLAQPEQVHNIEKQAEVIERVASLLKNE